VGKVFAEDGRLLDDAFVRRSDRFIRELIWMSKVLRYGREQVTIDDEAAEVPKPACPRAVRHSRTTPTKSFRPPPAKATSSSRLRARAADAARSSRRSP
jgi:hypothetical protein